MWWSLVNKFVRSEERVTSPVSTRSIESVECHRVAEAFDHGTR